MFDRIAGLYDRMNSVMTAGLHHAWRRRAADLAQLAPGQRALDVATGTGDLAFELARRVGPSGEVVASDFSERMLELARAKALAGAAPRCALRAPTRSRCPTPTTRSMPPRWASARGTSPIWPAACARWCGSCVRAVVSSCSRSPPRSARRCPPSSSCGSIGSSLRSGAWPATPRPTRICPTRCGAFPGPRSWPRVLWEAGLRDVRYVLTAGGIIALHAGTVESASQGGGSRTVAAGRFHWEFACRRAAG